MSRRYEQPGPPKDIRYPEELTGNSPEKSEHENLPEAEAGRPLSMAWISDDLLTKTQRVWSRAYGRLISEEEAVEILMNVKHMAGALLKAKRGGDVE